MEKNPGPERCSACNVIICAAGRRFRCSGGCGRVCHLRGRCSGVRRPDWESAHWRCQQCSAADIVTDQAVAGDQASSMDASITHPADQAVLDAPSSSSDGRTANPTGPEPRAERVKCRGCGITLYSKVKYPLVCCSCGSRYHLLCSGLPRGTHKSYATSGRWVCNPCTTAKRSAQPIPHPGLTRVGDNKVPLPRREQLFVLHWNACGIRTSFNEFNHLLQKRTIDICMVQETRLLPSDSLPSFAGYATLRRDRLAGRHRAGGRGGGLLILIKDDLPFCEVNAFRRDVERGELEALAVEIQAAGGLMSHFCECLLTADSLGACRSG